MTYQDAKAFFENFIKILEANGEKEILNNQYCASAKLAIEALEKQIPRKPRYVQYDGNPEVGNYHCTTCKRIIELEPIDHNEKVFCLHCGQALDWSDNDAEQT